MSNLTDRVSYIKGLAEGMKLDDSTNEGRIILKLLDIVGELAQENADIRKELSEVNEYVESIDEDLSEMEEAVYGDDEDEDECGCGCGHHHCHGDDDDDDEDDDEHVVEYVCPHCGEEMTFEVDNFDFDEDYLCPNCHQPLFPEEDAEDEKNEDEDK